MLLKVASICFSSSLKVLLEVFADFFEALLLKKKLIKAWSNNVMRKTLCMR